jgi:murein DD-endopeptidase MepM/ murein hydrolase activator NlpD
LNGKSVDDVPVGEESEIDEIVSSGQRLVVTTEADDGLKVVFQRKAFNLGYGNGKGDDGGGNDGGDEVTGVISPLGGQVIVPGLCSVTFPPGAFAAPTEVKVSVLRDASLFVADDITYSTVSRYIVPGITVTLASPMSANIEAVASFNVPDSLAGLESRISLLGRVVQSGSEESLSTQTLLLPQEQIVRQRTQAALGTVTGRLPSWAFSGPDPGSNIIDIILALRDEFPASSGSYPCYGAELTAPLSDPLFASKISSAFGPRVLPGSPTVHLGVDFGVPLGTPVYAADQGEVVAVNQNSPSAGKIVVVQHAHGFTRYLHLSEIYADMNHRTVPPNGIIGLSGRLGLTSTGAHLHFEYMPFGLLFETGTSPQFLSTDRVDPMACMARPAQGARIEILNFDFLMRLGDSRSLSAELRVPPNKVVGRDIFVWSAGVLPSQPGPVLSITSGGVVTAVGEGFGFAQAELRGSNSVTRNIVFPRQLFAHVDAFWGRYLGRAVVSGGTGYDGEYDFGMSFRENYTYEGGWGMQGHDLFLGYPLYSTKRVGNTIDFLWGDSGPPEQRSGTVTLVGDDISGSVKWLGGTVTFQAHYAGPIRASAEE